MNLISHARWQSMDGARSDEAHLYESEDSLFLKGQGSFIFYNNPAHIQYEVYTSPDGTARNGVILGVNGNRNINLFIDRIGSEWMLNGTSQKSVQGLLDLDFGFTPSTNYFQIQRMNLAIGETRKLNVAWIDTDSTSLIPLPQIYKRVSKQRYNYESPATSYKGVLDLAPNGFVQVYPELWEMKPEVAVSSAY